MSITSDPICCPKCGSDHIVYNPEFGYWRCECQYTWGYDSDDPDYDEAIAQRYALTRSDGAIDLCPICAGDRMVPNEFEGYDSCPTCGGSGYLGGDT